MKHNIIVLIAAMTLASMTSCDKENANDRPNTHTEDTTSTLSPTRGKIGGHEYVDLGLSVVWATRNIGAESLDDYGIFYAWGETNSKNYFSLDNYLHFNFHDSVYNVIGDNVGGTQYDAAQVNWGNGWRMPSKQEARALSMLDGSSRGEGTWLFGTTGDSIFLPYGGWRDSTALNDHNTGLYWLSTVANDTMRDCMLVMGGEANLSRLAPYFGAVVRPVHDK